MPQNQHYSDGAHVFVIYPADCVPPASTDDRDVLLVEDTENAALLRGRLWGDLPLHVQGRRCGRRAVCGVDPPARGATRDGTRAL